MKQRTKLWSQINDCLIDINDDTDFMKDIYKSFNEIFELKEVREYKGVNDMDWLSPALFSQLTQIMKRAFVEGYLLAKAEQKRKDVANLYKCYRKGLNDEKKINDSDTGNVVSFTGSTSDIT